MQCNLIKTSQRFRKKTSEDFPQSVLIKQKTYALKES